MKSLEVISNYYTKMDETTSFEPFKVLPSLIHALGNNYNHEGTEAIWYGTSIFLDTYAGIKFNGMKNLTLKLTDEELNQTLYSFTKYCAGYAVEGIKDGIYFETFESRLEQERFFDIFLALAGEYKAEALTAYLSLCELDRIKLRTNFSSKEDCSFGPLVFPQIIAQRYIRGTHFNDYPKLSNDLKTLHRFVEEKKFLSKTDLLIFNKILIQ